MEQQTLRNTSLNITMPWVFRLYEADKVFETPYILLSWVVYVYEPRSAHETQYYEGMSWVLSVNEAKNTHGNYFNTQLKQSAKHIWKWHCRAGPDTDC